MSRAHSTPHQTSRLVGSAAPLFALRILLDIFQSTDAREQRRWERAMPWSCLKAAGLSEADAQFLLAVGYIEHRVETTKGGASHRTFHTGGASVLSPRSCLMLTESGAGYAREWLALAENVAAEPRERPHWNRLAGELWWKGTLIKRFRHDAANQRFVLDAFETAGWSRCIENPFRKQGVQQPKRCLHRTIEGLNERQQKVLGLHFGGDGRGGVRWDGLA
jgi:hypothetical protein